MSPLIDLLKVDISKSIVQKDPLTFQLVASNEYSDKEFAIVDEFSTRGDINTMRLDFCKNSVNVKDLTLQSVDDLEKSLISKLIESNLFFKLDTDAGIYHSCIMAGVDLINANLRIPPNYLIINHNTDIDLPDNNRYKLIKSSFVPDDVVILFCKGAESYDQGFQVLTYEDKSKVHFFDNYRNYFRLLRLK